MKMTWVNHASFILDAQGVRLISDPWIEGTAFNGGWSLLSNTRLTYEDFGEISHIFLSHEHPDHFSPPNLKSIPEQIRKRITVLFHRTKDRRVVKFCKSLGYRIQELPNREWVSLKSDFKVCCVTEGMLDSWLAVKSEGKLILNLNDCVFPDKRELYRIPDEVGEVDVLLTQFSYANWVGNPDDPASHRASAQTKLEEIARRVRILSPKTLIPAASFFWFCHEENRYLNEHINKVGDVRRYATNQLGVRTHVLYPGDEWPVGEEFDSTDSIRKYNKDYEEKSCADLVKSPPVLLGQLVEAQDLYVKKVFRNINNNALLLNALPSAAVFLHDLNITVRVSFRGMQVLPSHTPADIVLSSDSLHYCLRYEWGADSLSSNARYEAPVGGNAQKFFWLFRVASHNSAGASVDFPFFFSQVVKRLTTKAVEA